MLCLLAQQGHDVEALTVSPDNGHFREEELAAAVAQALGVPHSTIQGGDAEFWDQTRERALRVDFQLAAPVGDAFGKCAGGRPGVATDGLALDTLAQAGDAYYTESMIRPDGAPRWRRSFGPASWAK